MATITVLNNSDTGSGSLRQAITDAAAGDVIEFDSSLNGGTILLASPLTIAAGIKIDASALADGLTISGNNAVRIFKISGGTADHHVELIGLKIVNGFGNINTKDERTQTYGGYETTYGIGIKLTGGYLTMYRCAVTGCVYSDTSSKSNILGTGIYAGSNTYLNLYSCLIAGNSSTATNSHYGGGIYTASTVCNIVNCTIAGNTQTSGSRYGCGIYYNAGTLYLYNNIIYNNTGTSSQIDNQNSLTYTGANNITTDPGFVSSSDYHLTASSTAVNAGDNTLLDTTAYDKDLDGNDRIYDTTIDAGCYEYTPPKCATPVITLTAGAGSCTIAVSTKPAYADKLVIQYSQTSDFASSTEIETTTNSFVQNSINGTYYFRAKWVDTDSVAADSEWSTTQSINIDGTAPVITGVQTDDPLSIDVGTTVNLLSGVTCLDNVDGNLQVYYTIKDEDEELVYDDDDNYVSIDTDCIPVGSYTIHYYATDTAGNRSADITRGLTVNLISLTAPTVTASSTTSSMTIEWGTNADASSVEVRYASTSAGLESATAQTASGNSFTLNDVALGTTYFFQVRYVGDGITYGNSSWSTAAKLTVPPQLPKPVITATALDWNKIRISGLTNANASAFKVRVSKSDGSGPANWFEALTVVPTDGHYDYTGLEATRAYPFQAQFVGDGTTYSDSEWSSVVSEQTLAHIGVSASGPNSVTLSEFSRQYASAVPNYTLWQYRMATTQAGLEDAVPVTLPQYGLNRSIEITSLTASTEYFFQIRNCELDGNGTVMFYNDWSVVASATTLATALTAPTVTATAVSGSTVNLSGLVNANASSVEVRYAATSAGLESAAAQTVTPTAGVCPITGLTAETTYYFQARFIGDGTNYSNSSWSTAVSATTGATADDDDLLYPEFKTLETTFGTMTVPFLTGSGMAGIIKKNGVI